MQDEFREALQVPEEGQHETDDSCEDDTHSCEDGTMSCEDWMSIYWKREQSGGDTPMPPLAVFAGALQQAAQAMDFEDQNQMHPAASSHAHEGMSQVVACQRKTWPRIQQAQFVSEIADKVVKKSEKWETDGNAFFDKAAAVAQKELQDARRRAIEASLASVAAGVAEGRGLMRGAAGTATSGVRKGSRNIAGVVFRFAQKSEY